MARQFGGTPGVQRTNRWQDWCNLVLAIWLFISPWVLVFSGGAPAPTAGTPGAGPGIAGPAATTGGDAAWNAWVLGVIVFLVALSAIGRMEFWQEWINLLLGAWIFVAPWALGFAGRLPNASWDHWIVGALIFLISLSNLSSVRRSPTSVDMAHAGDKPPPSEPPPL
jgi:hypothetical protein